MSRPSYPDPHPTELTYREACRHVPPSPEEAKLYPLFVKARMTLRNAQEAVQDLAAAVERHADEPFFDEDGDWYGVREDAGGMAWLLGLLLDLFASAHTLHGDALEVEVLAQEPPPWIEQALRQATRRAKRRSRRGQA